MYCFKSNSEKEQIGCPNPQKLKMKEEQDKANVKYIIQFNIRE
jgi:hypothetical protein